MPFGSNPLLQTPRRFTQETVLSKTNKRFPADYGKDGLIYLLNIFSKFCSSCCVLCFYAPAGPSHGIPIDSSRRVSLYTFIYLHAIIYYSHNAELLSKRVFCLLEKIIDSAFISFIYVISSFHVVCLMCNVIVSLCTSTEYSLIGPFK